MEFKCTTVRALGVVMPRWRQNGKWRRGVLTVTEERDPELLRTVRVARFTDGRQGADLHSPLFDAVLLSAVPDRLVLTGFERLTLGKLDTLTCFQQSWVLVAMSAYDVSQADAFAAEQEVKRRERFGPPA